MTTIDTAVIESLRDFALANGEIAFNYLCNAALDGEEWAANRLADAIAVWTYLHAVACEITRDKFHEFGLQLIRATDTTRPDGTIARSFEV